MSKYITSGPGHEKRLDQCNHGSRNDIHLNGGIIDDSTTNKQFDPNGPLDFF